jgi:hypothetical protein
VTGLRRLVAPLVLFATVACGSPSPSASESAPTAQVVLLPPQAGAYPGEPWTLDGKRVPTEVISLTRGAEVCGYDHVLLLTMAKVLGKPALTSDDALQYVRDPSNQFANATAGSFEPSVEKPPDALFSGYRYGSMELWTSSASGADVIFLARDGVWERWPRARDLFACAA